MRYIDTSLISDPSKQQPFKGPSLAFLQAQTIEGNTAFARSIMGDNLWNVCNNNTVGCAIAGLQSASGGSVRGNGYIYFNGELYYCPGHTGLLSPPYTTGSNVPVFTLVTTPDAVADPTTFTDYSTANVHNYKTLAITAGLTGSGLFDLSQLQYVYNLPTFLALGNYTTTTAGSELVTGSTITTPALGPRHFKLRISGMISFLDNTAAIDGATLKIRNLTTSTDLQIITTALQSDAGAGGQNKQLCFSTEVLTLNVTGGNQFGCTVIRTGASNVQVTDLVFTCEEVRM